MTDRYGCEQVDAIWTDDAKFARWVRVWHGVAMVLGHPFDLPDEFELQQITKRAAVLEVQYGHDVAAGCESLREWLRNQHEDDAAHWLHYGLCSSDVTDSGLVFAIDQATEVLADLAREAAEALDRIGATERQVVYRTHGQAAQVASDSSRWSRFGTILTHQAQLLEQAAYSHLYLPTFDGPTGTGGELDPAQRASITSYLFAVDPKSVATEHTGSQAMDRWPVVNWTLAVAALATTTGKVATQVRLLSQTGIDEVAEGRPATYRGSSSMPHKHNPTRSERICGLAPVIRALANGYASAASSCWDAHSLEHSSAERVCLPQVTGLTGYVLTELREIAQTLRFNLTAIERNIQAAPDDSYRRRNRLIREGTPGDVAWVAAKPESRSTSD